MQSKHEQLMREAIALGIEAFHNLHGGPFGAIVVKDGKVVGKGGNRVMADADPTAHAEVVAIREACKALGTPELVGCDIYTSSEPCPMCMAAIYWACINKVYYSNTVGDTEARGFEDAFIYSEFHKSNHERSVEMIHLPLKEAIDALDEWEAKQPKGTGI